MWPASRRSIHILNTSFNNDSSGKIIYQNTGTVKGHIEIHKFAEKDAKSDSGCNHNNDKNKW